MNRTIALGADIGGSHITAGLIDLESKTVIPHTTIRKRVVSNGSADDIIAVWAEVIEDAIASGNDIVDQIGIAMPGPFDYEKGICLIKNQNKYDNLYGLNIRALLAERLGFKEQDIHFMNDAACFLKGELCCGSLGSYSKGIGLTLGTGLGTASNKDNKVVDANMWNMPFKDGIAEDYISTKWFLERHKELFGTSIEGVRDLVENEEVSKEAEILFEEFSENLASFIYEFIQVAQPEAVVIGGNISNAYPLFLDQSKKSLYKLTGYEIPVEKSILGENAALIGAAFL